MKKNLNDILERHLPQGQADLIVALVHSKDGLCEVIAGYSAHIEDCNERDVSLVANTMIVSLIKQVILLLNIIKVNEEQLRAINDHDIQEFMDKVNESYEYHKNYLKERDMLHEKEYIHS